MKARRLIAATALLAVLALGAWPAAGQAGAPSNRIVGGSAVAEGDFPFAGAVVYAGGAPRFDRRRETCTATLIRPDVAITAAHCFLTFNPYAPMPFVAKEKLDFVFGKRVLSSPDPGQRAKVASVFIPTGFRPTAALSPQDFAIVHLDHALTVPTAPLLPKGAEANAVYGAGSFAGWGVRRPFARAAADALRTGSGTIVPTTSCRGPVALRQSAAFLCLAGRSAGAVCHGDSGGPLVVGGPFLVGVTDYTLQNCSTRGAAEGFASLDPSGPNYGLAEAASRSVDTVPPQITVTKPLPDPMPRGNRHFSFAFHASEPVRAVCMRGRRAVACARGVDGGVGLTPGKHRGPGLLRVIAFDQSFNPAEFDFPFRVG
jgi:secreted trypsin-like serine protease